MHKTKKIIADFVLDRDVKWDAEFDGGSSGNSLGDLTPEDSPPPALDTLGTLRTSQCGTGTVLTKTPENYAGYMWELDQIMLQRMSDRLDELDRLEATRKPPTLMKRWRRYLSAPVSREVIAHERTDHDRHIWDPTKQSHLTC